MGLVRKIFSNIIVKSLILTILPTIYGVAIPLCFSGYHMLGGKSNCIRIAIFTFILHIIALSVYGYKESKQNKTINDIKSIKIENENSKNLITLSNKVVRDNAHMFHELVFAKKGHSDITDWHLIEGKGDEICTSVHHMVSAIAESGKDFSVSIMFKKVENGTTGYTMSSRVATDSGHNPRSYRSLISEDKAEGFYYKKIFDESPTKPQILHNKQEIKRHFKENSSLNYSQYIAIPITCKSNKIVGILQIVAYNNSIILRKKRDLTKITNQYFSLYATLMLLCDKYENVQQVFNTELK